MFLLSKESDFHMIDGQSTIIHTFARYMLTSLSVHEILLSGYINRSSIFRGLPLKIEMAPSCLKLMNSILFAFTLSSMLLVAYSKIQQRFGFSRLFERNAWSFASNCQIFCLYYLLLVLFSVKLFPLIKSIVVRST